MSLSLTAKKGTKETLGGFSVGRKPVRCRSDVTLPTPRIIQDGLLLHSLNNSTVQPHRVNSGLSGVNVLFLVFIWSFLQADIYQPACPSNSTLFVDASPRLFAHSVMPQTPLCFSL